MERNGRSPEIIVSLATRLTRALLVPGDCITLLFQTCSQGCQAPEHVAYSYVNKHIGPIFLLEMCVVIFRKKWKKKKKILLLFSGKSSRKQCLYPKTLLFLIQPRVAAFSGAGLEIGIFLQTTRYLYSEGQTCQGKQFKECEGKSKTWLNDTDPTSAWPPPQRTSLCQQPCPREPAPSPAESPLLARQLSDTSGGWRSEGFDQCRARKACCQVTLTRCAAWEPAVLSFPLWLHGKLKQEDWF